ncbi:MAG: IS3 family transposase [Proteobacteria bacterium]|nr:IS3 family transposase [Pseudomonadota bacterium]
MTISALCKASGISRQAYYKKREKRRLSRQEEQAIFSAVKEVRQKHPRQGVRKLLYKLRPQLEAQEIRIGRDRLFDLLRGEHLLVTPQRRRMQTTNSRHRFRTYRNVIKDMDVGETHQVWVNDLTYIRTDEGHVFLALVTDSYSRKIVGYEVSDTLESVGCLRALKKAMKQLPKGKKPIHHSDRGTQYCCNEYIKCLKKRELGISMTEENHCYENAQAERVNGILKGEYLLGRTFLTKAQARKSCAQAIHLYNTDRPHLAHNMLTPEEVHAA